MTGGDLALMINGLMHIYNIGYTHAYCYIANYGDGYICEGCYGRAQCEYIHRLEEGE